MFHKHWLFIDKVLIHKVPGIPSKLLAYWYNHCSLGESFISTLNFSNRSRKSMIQIGEHWRHFFWLLCWKPFYSSYNFAGESCLKRNIYKNGLYYIEKSYFFCLTISAREREELSCSNKEDFTRAYRSLCPDILISLSNATEYHSSGSWRYIKHVHICAFHHRS